ncbi:MAG: MFS transporter [Gammaproteobacteria bacterium]|nr:MFS transporter [Gammaproteobacteria bacterium]
MNTPLRGHQKLSYGFGQLGEGFQNGAVEAFLFFYYTQVLGLSGTLTGAAVLVALLFDAVTDPLVGSLSDSAKTRWGRRHPFMMLSAIPTALSFYLVFTPPAGLTEFNLFLWLAGFAVLVRASMTLFVVPYSAMTAELSDDPTERTSIAAYRSVFSILGWLSVSMAGTMYFFRATPNYELGTLNPAAYPAFGAVVAIAIAIPIVVSTLATFGLRDRLFEAAVDHHFSMRGMINDAATAMSFPAFRILIIAGLVAFLATGMRLALLVHLKSFFFEMNSQEIGYTMVATLVGMLSGLVLWNWVSRRLEKKTCYMIGVAWMGFFALFPVAVYYFGWLPVSAGHTGVVMLVIVASFLSGLGGASVSLMTISMLADVTDENELQTGRRQEGIYFGTSNFLHKCSSGLGHFVAGVGLDLIAFPSDAIPGEVAPEIINRLGLLYGPGVLFCCLIASFIMRRYPLSRDRHAEIIRQLEAQRPTSAKTGSTHDLDDDLGTELGAY